MAIDQVKELARREYATMLFRETQKNAWSKSKNTVARSVKSGIGAHLYYDSTLLVTAVY